MSLLNCPSIPLLHTAWREECSSQEAAGEGLDWLAQEGRHSVGKGEERGREGKGGEGEGEEEEGKSNLSLPGCSAAIQKMGDHMPTT